MYTIKEKWKQFPVLGKVGLLVAIIVPMGLVITGIITLIIKLTRNKK